MEVISHKERDKDYPYGKIVWTDEVREIQLPSGAVNLRATADKPADDPHFQQCTQQEARGAFLAGWLASGGNGDQCMKYFEGLK
jgi:hypothetical protein